MMVFEITYLLVKSKTKTNQFPLTNQKAEIQ